MPHITYCLNLKKVNSVPLLPIIVQLSVMVITELMSISEFSISYGMINNYSITYSVVLSDANVFCSVAFMSIVLSSPVGTLSAVT